MHVLRDGTAMEMVGRLCVKEGRNASIERAIAAAEAPRPIRVSQTWHHHVISESRNWRLEGALRTPNRHLVRVEAGAGGGAARSGAPRKAADC